MHDMYMVHAICRLGCPFKLYVILEQNTGCLLSILIKMYFIIAINSLGRAEIFTVYKVTMDQFYNGDYKTYMYVHALNVCKIGEATKMTILY